MIGCDSSLMTLVSAGVCQCFVSVQELRVAVCQEVAVNYAFAWRDQQTEWQCQGAPVRSSECPVAFSGP